MERMSGAKWGGRVRRTRIGRAEIGGKRVGKGWKSKKSRWKSRKRRWGSREMRWKSRKIGRRVGRNGGRRALKVMERSIKEEIQVEEYTK